jgi:hypothetical protein
LLQNGASGEVSRIFIADTQLNMCGILFVNEVASEASFTEEEPG